MTETSLFRPAVGIMTELIVQGCLSYADAITRAEEMAEAVAAPYHEVAAYLRAELDRARVSADA